MKLVFEFNYDEGSFMNDKTGNNLVKYFKLVESFKKDFLSLSITDKIDHYIIK
jgi:hypothetical protein